MKKLFVMELQEVNGEQEYLHHELLLCEDLEQAKIEAFKYAETWYMDTDEEGNQKPFKQFPPDEDGIPHWTTGEIDWYLEYVKPFDGILHTIQGIEIPVLVLPERPNGFTPERYNTRLFCEGVPAYLFPLLVEGYGLIQNQDALRLFFTHYEYLVESHATAVRLLANMTEEADFNRTHARGMKADG